MFLYLGKVYVKLDQPLSALDYYRRVSLKLVYIIICSICCYLQLLLLFTICVAFTIVFVFLTILGFGKVP